MILQTKFLDEVKKSSLTNLLSGFGVSTFKNPYDFLALPLAVDCLMTFISGGFSRLL